MLERKSTTVGIVLMGGLMLVFSLTTGSRWLLLAAVGLLVAGTGLAWRARRVAASAFPEIEITPECEWRTAYLRLTNLDAADTLQARVVRVTLENTLTERPPWAIAWADAAGSEMLLNANESQRLELGRIDPGDEKKALPELHFRRPRLERGPESVSMPWPEGVRDETHPDGASRRHVRAEIELRSEQTGGARLIQVRIGVQPPDWTVDLQLVSIDFTEARGQELLSPA